jgi:hypothetical protein
MGAKPPIDRLPPCVERLPSATIPPSHVPVTVEGRMRASTALCVQLAAACRASAQGQHAESYWAEAHTRAESLGHARMTI